MMQASKWNVSHLNIYSFATVLMNAALMLYFISYNIINTLKSEFYFFLLFTDFSDHTVYTIYPFQEPLQYVLYHPPYTPLRIPEIQSCDKNQ